MNKKIMLVAALLAGAAISTSVVAQPGQCSVTGYGTFDCDVVVDGGGFSFALPNGQVLAFTLSEADLGSAFLLAADAKPGKQPRELDDFKPKPSKPGCWVRDDGFEFCALVFEGEGT